MLKYRLFHKSLKALIYKGRSCFSKGILLILLFFRTPTDFRIGTYTGVGLRVCGCVQADPNTAPRGIR
ncbi:Hypothetical protein PSEBR_m443 [Pseudomonas brassicacearum subsp. brassicacearum NFM421]|uniref:Uncharacterized protein n=1 Tax=Pseudomonas brassicacearum (strain NFM421) TaxID=994484 RepID=F2KE22_PSEBN|nr:Hypothetical protein PSEBR_m443 [Pseudomonas brassicacearum subsp. brassicacearum NFM421]